MAANHDLCFTTGSEAIEAFKKKKLSPVELMNAVISRCEEVNPRLNAVTYSFFERALEQAKKDRGFKVALSIDLGYVHVDPEVERNTRAAAEAFKELGCTVEEVDVGWDWGVLDCWMTWWEGLF